VISVIPDRDPPNDRLYRYMSLQTPDREGWARDIFVKHELYFPSPTSFNDPFDCKVPPLDSLPKGQRKQYVDELIRRKITGRLPRHEKRAAKRRLSTRKTFAEVTLHLQTNIDACGVLCLSERYDDILMWSHYADSHRGICLEFEATANTPLFGEAQPVEYAETYTDFPLLGGGFEQVDRAMLTKSSHWKYEGEWRIIRRSQINGVPAGPSVRRSQFSAKYLRGVIFGCQCSSETESRVTSWIAEGGCQMTRYKARVKRKEYGLDITPLP
jgi:Protein of unknown function (DUF2971)